MTEEEVVQETFSLIPYLPYIVSVLCSVISGIASYAVTRRETKADIQRLEKQHILDLDKEREMFKMEKEKMELSHKYEMELKQKELENALGTSVTNTLISEAMKMPEVRQQFSQGVRQGAKKKH